MDSPPRYQYRVRWFEKFPGAPTVAQSHRYRNLHQALAFVARLRAEQPGVRVVLERREAILTAWEPVAIAPEGGAK